MNTIPHRKFHRCRQIDIRGGSPFADFAEMRYHAATVAPVTGILRFQSCRQQHLVARAVIMHSRETSSAADQLAYRHHKLRRTVWVNTHAEARLVGFYFFCRFQTQIGNLISSIAAISFAAANRKILERIIAGKELRRITGNRPYPF